MKTRSTRVDSPSRIIKRRVLLKNTPFFFSTIDHPIESIEFTFEREEEIVESAKIENLGRSRELPSPSMNKKKRKGEGGGKKTFFSRVEKKGINMKSGGAGEREPAIIDTRRTRVCSLNVDSIRIRADSNDVRPGFYEFPREQFSSTWISKRRSFISMRPNFPSTLQIVFLPFFSLSLSPSFSFFL